ncbi:MULTISPECIES: TlpA family protein disulfide reductase [unclassified Pseudoalteromonas]|uniref:TlpA family protein disulfide reductase n=1 Tax=unclassified Pseudoalteromonas TaxID=194690 RepID=UPI0030142BBC
MSLIKLILLHIAVFLSLIAHANTQEYVFINIWDEYVQPTALPLPLAPRRLLQPDINIDEASLAQFKMAYPSYAELAIDKHNQFMQRFAVRQTPVRIIVKGGKVIKREVLTTTSIPKQEKQTRSPLQTLTGRAFSIANIDSEYRVLFFSDSLCPFQHIPDCEIRIKQNNQLVDSSRYPVVTLIKPFYVEEQNARDYQRRFKIEHDIVFDHHNEVFSQFEIRELPYWVVQDKHGDVIYRGNQPPSID